MDRKAAEKRPDHDSEIIGYGLLGLVAIGAAVVAGPVAIGLTILVGGAVGVIGKPALGVVVGLAGGAVSIWPGSRFYDGYWGERIGQIKEAVQSGQIERFFFHNMMTPEHIALGLIGAGVAALSLALYENGPARRFYREGQKGGRVGVRPGRMEQWSARRLSKRPAVRKGETVLGATIPGGTPLTISDSSLNTHTLIGGTTGSGKTVTVANLVESFIMRGLPVVFIDGKGDPELAQQVGNIAKAAGRPSWLFTMRDIAGSCKYNPVASGGFSSKKDRVIDLREWSEQHYKKLAEGYLQMVFKVLDRTGHTVDLITATEYLDRNKLSGLLRDAVKNKVLDKDEAKTLSDEIGGQADAEEHIEGLRAELRNLAHSELAPLFDTSVTGPAPVDKPLVLSDVLQSGGVAYMCLYPFAFPNLSDVLGKLIVNDLKASFGQSSQKVLVVIDEFTTLAGPQILNLMNQGRSAGVHAVLTVQGLADLAQKIHGNALLFARQIISNCNVFCIHRMNNPSDADELAAIIGKEWKMDISAQVGERGATGSGNVRRVRDWIADPDEIKGLERGCGLFMDKNTGKFTRYVGRFGWLFQR